MNAPEILTKFETMVGDSLDQDFELQLANDAMHEITTAIDLPSDFFLPAPWIYVGTERCYQVPFERPVEYRDSNGYYYVDTANGEYHLCGSGCKSFAYKPRLGFPVPQPNPASDGRKVLRHQRRRAR